MTIVITLVCRTLFSTLLLCFTNFSTDTYFFPFRNFWFLIQLMYLPQLSYSDHYTVIIIYVCLPYLFLTNLFSLFLCGTSSFNSKAQGSLHKLHTYFTQLRDATSRASNAPHQTGLDKYDDTYLYVSTQLFLLVQSTAIF